ncbi:MAG: hypothetical protein AB7S26_06380 [Sandaracinaceae bacterium]
MTSRHRVALAIATLAAPSLGCLFGPAEGAIPDPSTCLNAPPLASIDEVAVGSAPGRFIALQDGAGTYVAEDEIGAEWMAVRAAWRGTGAPACARVRIALRDPSGDAELAHRTLQLTSSPQDGWRVSDEVYFEARDLPDEVVAVVEVYDAVGTTTVAVGGYTADGDAGP